MNDELKTKIQLIAELTALRKQVADLTENIGTAPESPEEKDDQKKEGDNTYRDLLQNIPALVFRMHLRKNMNMSFYNDMLKTMTGYTPEEITRDAVCSLYHLILPEDREGVLATIERALLNNESFQVEYRFRHKDGSLRHFAEKGTPIFGEDRKPLFIDGIIIDNTEYRMTGEALRETQERFRSLVESVGDWIWEIDTRGSYTYVSPRVTDVLGYDAASLFGKTIYDLTSSGDTERLKQVFQESVAAKKPLVTLEKVCLHKDGQARTLEMSGIPFLNTDGVIVGYRGMDRDITERKNIETRQKLHCDILKCLNQAADLPQLIREMTSLMTEGGKFDAAAVTIRGAEAASGYYASGLADPFRALEKTKDNLDDTQRLVKPDSRPSLEYLYGCILRGQIDPAFAAMADGGSFWTNHLSEDPDLFDPPDRPSPLHDAFQQEGYESLALIPVTSEREILGLLQIMDRRENHFDADTIDIMEKAGQAVGQFLKKERKSKDIAAAKNRLEGRLEIVPDWIWETNQDLGLTYVGRQVQHLLGYGSAELFNQNILAIMPEAENENIEAFIKEQEASDRPAVKKVVFKNKDGVPVTLDMSVVPLMDDGGNRKGFRGICREPAAAAPVVDNLFLSITEDNPAGVYIAQDGIFKYMNSRAAEMAGYEKGALIGKSTMDLVHHDDRAVLSDHLRRMLHGAEDAPCQFRIDKTDGSFAWLMQTVRSVQYEDKPAVLGAFMDITSFKRKETEERQSYQTETLDNVSTGLIREINNILAFVNGYTEIAQAEAGDESLKQTIAQIALSCRRGKTLLDKISTITGHGKYEKGSVDLNSLIIKTMEGLGGTLPTAIEIRPAASSEPCFVLADPEQLYQVLNNLCSNAAYAMRNKGGTLSVRTDRISSDRPESPSAVRLIVSDTGQGIEPENLDRIFDPFWTTKTPGEGSGLGLSLVQAIVKDLGGTFQVKSKPGEGTTFMLDLPLIDPSRIPEIKPAVMIPRGHENVLFIDDNEAAANLGDSLLKSLGYQTVTLTDTARAVELIETDAGRFDLAVIDMTMPDINGMNLARKIAEIRPGLPMILCKGKTEIIAEAEAKRAGIRGFILKPLSRRNLAESVRKVLDEEKAGDTQESTES
jgi:PAS domain S-box-containing protein